MQVSRQEVVRSAGGRIRRGRKTVGRLVVSALGFGVAYYFDTENGSLRRKRLHHAVQQTVLDVRAARAADTEGQRAVLKPGLQSEERAQVLNGRVGVTP